MKKLMFLTMVFGLIMVFTNVSFAAALNSYEVKVAWQCTDEANYECNWQDDAVWTFSGNPLAVKFSENEAGSRAFSGFIKYSDEKGEIKVAAYRDGNNFNVCPEEKIEEFDYDWTLGGRGEKQYITSIDVTSQDGGQTLLGRISYNGEGPILFKAVKK